MSSERLPGKVFSLGIIIPRVKYEVVEIVVDSLPCAVVTDEGVRQATYSGVLYSICADGHCFMERFPTERAATDYIERIQISFGGR